jgi:deoxyribose-phosphate aldolase
MSLNINEYIDHTLLKAQTTEADIISLCEEAVEHGFAAVCIPPYYIKTARNILKDGKVNLATVVGFPLGYEHIGTKVDSIKRCIEQGADEIDAVINIAAVKNHKWVEVESEIDSLTTACRIKNKTIKVIIEAALLSNKELDKVLDICSSKNATYIKTSTGYQVPEDQLKLISYLRTRLPESIKIKASGGIRDLASAKALILAGANRLGTSSALKILNL